MKDKFADNTIHTFANVIFKENDRATYCYLADCEIHAGDLAAVMTEKGRKYVLVAYIDKATADKAPYPFEKLKRIEGRVTKGAPKYDELYNKYLKPTAYIWDDDDNRREVSADGWYADKDWDED